MAGALLKVRRSLTGLTMNRPLDARSSRCSLSTASSALSLAASLSGEAGRVIFFRDDDLGWEHGRFEELLGVFVAAGARLNAAAIPAACAGRYSRGDFARWQANLQVHTHGWSHANHAPAGAGKKAEYGPHREFQAVAAELLAARQTVTELFGPLSFPAFTPPWNRLADVFVPALVPAGFHLLSRDGPPRAGCGIPEANVSLDLHTDRRHPGRGVRDWLKAIDESPAGPVGLMVHHGHMASGDFTELARLLDAVAERGWRTIFFSEWMELRGKAGPTP